MSSKGDLKIVDPILTTIIACLTASAIHGVSEKNTWIRGVATVIFAVFFLRVGWLLWLASSGRGRCTFGSTASAAIIGGLLSIGMLTADAISDKTSIFRKVGPGKIAEIEHIHQSDWAVTIEANGIKRNYLCTKAAIKKYGLEVGNWISGLHYQKRFIHLVVNDHQLVKLEESVQMLNRQQWIATVISCVMALAMTCHLVFGNLLLTSELSTEATTSNEEEKEEGTGG